MVKAQDRKLFFADKQAVRAALLAPFKYEPDAFEIDVKSNEGVLVPIVARLMISSSELWFSAKDSTYIEVRKRIPPQEA